MVRSSQGSTRMLTPTARLKGPSSIGALQQTSSYTFAQVTSHPGETAF